MRDRVLWGIRLYIANYIVYNSRIISVLYNII